VRKTGHLAEERDSLFLANAFVSPVHGSLETAADEYLALIGVRLIKA
jgi:hypothetical protein